MGLYFGKNKSDTVDIASFLIDQLEGHQRLHGCKLYHYNCIQADYVVTQSTVKNLLKIHKKPLKLSHYNVNILRDHFHIKM